MTSPVENPDPDATSIGLSLASPNDIRSWSYGGIETDKLFDFEGEQFHPSGLFSERIFGPIRDWKCTCGKYSTPLPWTVVCDVCHVRVGHYKIRKQRMAHIELPVPVVHPLFYGRDDLPVELLLGLTPRELDQLVRRARFIQLKGRGPHLQSLLYTANEAAAEGDASLQGFLDRSGANAVGALLKRMPYATLLSILERYEDYLQAPPAQRSRSITSLLNSGGLVAGAVRQSPRLSARLEMLRRVVSKGFVPKLVVLEALPVIPAGLRGAELLDHRRIRVDAITARYQRILRICASIRRRVDVDMPDAAVWPHGKEKRKFVANERRLSAEIAGLFDDLLHRVHRNPAPTAQPRWPGNRVHFSAPAVLVPDPTLRLFECRLPRKHVAEALVAPFVVPDASDGIEVNLAAAELRGEATQHPLMLSIKHGQPPRNILTLHPRLTDSTAMHVHPLVASTVGRTFADLDATIHLPLSVEAGADCDRLSFPTAAMRDPATGESAFGLTADAAVGCFYATWMSQEHRNLHKRANAGERWLETPIHAFASLFDVQAAWEAGFVQLNDVIALRLAPGQLVACGASDERVPTARNRRHWTTVGRALLNACLPSGSCYFDIPFNESALRTLLREVLDAHGALAAEQFAERACEFGLRVLSREGLSLSLSDLLPPQSNEAALKELNQSIHRFNRLHHRGVICDRERTMQIVDAVRTAKGKIANGHFLEMESTKDGMPPLLAVAGAPGRVNFEKLGDLAGIVGIVTSSLPPVVKSYVRGIDLHSYFQLAGAARGIRMESMTSTAAPRRLQRRVMSALHDVVVTEADCRAREGVVVQRFRDEAAAQLFAQRLAGRVTLHDAIHEETGQTIVGANELITQQLARKLEASGAAQLQVRSPLGCRARVGICQKCYGADPATGRLVDLGAAVGVKAAIAAGPVLHAIHRLYAPAFADSWGNDAIDASVNGVVSLGRCRTVVDGGGRRRVTSPKGILEIFSEDKVVAMPPIPHGAEIHVSTGSDVAVGTLLATWDRWTYPVHAQESGTVRIMPAHEERGGNFLTISDARGAVVDACFLPSVARIHVTDGSRVEAGAMLTTFRWVPSRGRRSTTRLKPLKQLFEARRPRERALVAEVDATVELQADVEQARCTILLHGARGGDPWRVDLPWNGRRHVVARHGQIVRPGDPLTVGDVWLGDLVRTRGVDEVRRLIMAEVDKRLGELKTGRPTDERPWELLVAEMLRYFEVAAQGDTSLVVGQVVSSGEVMAANLQLRKKVRLVDPKQYSSPLYSKIMSREDFRLAERRRIEEQPELRTPETMAPWPAGWRPLLLSIDELALRGSFLTTGGLVPTRDGLVRAALESRKREVNGAQESLLAGQLMPAGSGWGPPPDLD